MAMGYPVTRALYNVYFHPLAKFPGPKTWAMTRLRWVFSMVRGRHYHDIKDLHDKYGPVVRVAPDELSFIDGQAWSDILTKKDGEPGLQKSQIIFDTQEFHSWFDKSDANHNRVRRGLAASFAEPGLLKQEPLLALWVGRFVDKLHDAAANNQTIDMMTWLNWLSFDIAGDMVFTESFDQLEQAASHPWIAMITSNLVYSSLATCIRFYPPLDRLMPLLAPPSLHKLKCEFVSMAKDKVERRLKRNNEKLPDTFSSVYQTFNMEEEPLDFNALVGTFTSVMIASSETVATTLVALINFLDRTPHVQERLQQEVRSVPDSRDLTMATTAAMPYLNAVIKEGLRLCHPITGALARFVPPGGKVIAGHFVPGNTYVGIPNYAAYHSASNFDSPEDFNPKRWLKDSNTSTHATAGYQPEDTSTVHNDAIFRPFSVGVHNCIGQSLARAEMRLVLAHLVHEFDFEAVDMPRWDEQNCYFLVQKRPHLVRLRSVSGALGHSEMGT
ncbi:cytochrome P450 [Aspergillus californicus]